MSWQNVRSLGKDPGYQRLLGTLLLNLLVLISILDLDQSVKMEFYVSGNWQMMLCSQDVPGKT